MIDNIDSEEVRTLLSSLEVKSVEGRTVVLLRQSDPIYHINPDMSGLDFSCKGKVKGVDNRANIKIFSPDDSTLVVFFYKKSNVPWSRDRFAYGGMEYPGDGSSVNDDDIQSWLSFAESGFSPESRPDNLIRLFPYDIPA